MAETLQKKLLRMNNEIMALKTAQTKPASLKTFWMTSSTVQPNSTHTIQYKDDGETYAPIVKNTSSVLMLPFDPSTNSQQFISLYAIATTIPFSASREIVSIV